MLRRGGTSLAVNQYDNFAGVGVFCLFGSHTTNVRYKSVGVFLYKKYYMNLKN